MLSFVKVCEHNFIEGKVLRVTKLCKYPHEYLQFDSLSKLVRHRSELITMIPLYLHT